MAGRPRTKGIDSTRGRRALAEVMERRELSQAALGDMLGVPQPTISLWLSGENRPQAHQREALERVLKIKTSDWMTDAEYLVAFGRERRAA